MVIVNTRICAIPGVAAAANAGGVGIQTLVGAASGRSLT